MTSHKKNKKLNKISKCETLQSPTNMILYFIVQESQFWKLYKEDLSSCSVVMRTSVGVVYLLACLLEPFMPSFSIEASKYALRLEVFVIKT